MVWGPWGWHILPRETRRLGAYTQENEQLEAKNHPIEEENSVSKPLFFEVPCQVCQSYLFGR